MKTAAKGKILHLFWLLVALFQLLFAAQLAPAKSAFVPENRTWEIFPLAVRSHQSNPSQVTEPQRERAPPAAKTVLGVLLAPESETIAGTGSLLSGVGNTITAVPYGDLSGTLPDGFQANHLNQDAAFRDVIPSDEGLSIGMKGNAFTEPGTPHYDFHASLEQFWNQYRPNGALYPSVPTNEEYGQAVQEALQAGGYSPQEAVDLANQAAEQRLQFWLTPEQPVPRLPGRLPQKQPVTNDASTNGGNTQ